MNHILLVYEVLLVLAELQSLNISLDDADWNSFKLQYGKQYKSSQEESMRRIIFSWNKYRVEQFNANSSHELGFTLGINDRSDWTNSELDRLNGINMSEERIKHVNNAEAQAFLDEILNDDSVEVPEELDWRKTPGRVTGVKNQGQCGSCWAFSATGSLEGQQLVRNSSRKALIELSEQNLIDCVLQDRGCSGGYLSDAFDYVHAHGIMYEWSYRYEEKNGKCRFDQRKSIMSDKGYAYSERGDEQKLKMLVAKYGPVSVLIDATGFSFFSYQNGVYNNPNCFNVPEKMNHAVLIVGYGTDEKQGDYWLVKNSWGRTFGLYGYIKMSRNKNNQCGIALFPTIPVF